MKYLTLGIISLAVLLELNAQPRGHAHQFSQLECTSLYGLLTKENKQILPPKFDSLEPAGIYNKIIVDNKSGVVDSLGSIIILPQFDDVYCPNKEIFLGKKNELWAVFNYALEQISTYKYSRFEPYFTDELIKVVAGKRDTINHKQASYSYFGGAIDAYTGEEVVACNYDFISKGENGFSVVVINNKRGVVYKNGVLVVPTIHNDIRFEKESKFFNAGIVPVKLDNNKYILIDSLGQQVIDESLDQIYITTGKIHLYDQSTRHLMIASVESKKALIDRTGKKCTSFIYDTIYFCRKQEGYIGRRGDINVYINTEGLEKIVTEKKLLETPFADKELEIKVYSDFHSELYDYAGQLIRNSSLDLYAANYRKCVTNDKGKSGYEDWLGNLVIPHKYDLGSAYNRDTLLFVSKAIKKWGITIGFKNGMIDINGNEVLPQKYLDIHKLSHSTGNYALLENNKYAISVDGGKPASTEYHEIRHAFSSREMYHLVYNKSKLGVKVSLIDSLGNELIPVIYDYIGSISQLVPHYDSWSKDTGEYGVMRKDGKVALFQKATWKPITPFIYDEIYYTNTKLIAYKENKQGILNYEGKEIIPCIYDKIEVLSDGAIKVRQNAFWGVVDDNNKLIIPIQYTAIESYYDNLLIIGVPRENDKYSLLQ